MINPNFDYSQQFIIEIADIGALHKHPYAPKPLKPFTGTIPANAGYSPKTGQVYFKPVFCKVTVGEVLVYGDRYLVHQIHSSLVVEEHDFEIFTLEIEPLYDSNGEEYCYALKAKIKKKRVQVSDDSIKLRIMTNISQAIEIEQEVTPIPTGLGYRWTYERNSWICRGHTIIF